MSYFTTEEINLICIYDPGNRAGTIYELRDMMRYLMPDERELKLLTQGVIEKLEQMTDREYDALSEELAMTACESFESFDCEDAAHGSMGPYFYDDIDPDSEPE